MSKPALRQSIQCGGEIIEYDVIPAARRRTSIRIRVLPGGAVRVEAPPAARPEDVLRAMRNRAERVLRRVREARGMEPIPELRYVSGDIFLFLGRRCILDVAEAEKGAPEDVRLLGGRLAVRTAAGRLAEGPERLRARVRRMIRAWYVERAAEHFRRRIDVMLVFGPAPEGVTGIAALRTRFMKSRWGSCTSDGVVTLNAHLIKAPPRCIDQVILHELCHLRVPGHGPRFRLLLESLMPDWRIQRDRLEGMAERILNE